MKTKQLTLLASAIMLCPIGSVAQNNETDNTQIVKVEAGVKTYYPSKMGFSPNEPINNVIKMIGMYSEVSNHSLMVNGENYLLDAESFFAHTLVADVERIEIVTDPNLCGNTIGTDGNINIVLRNKEEGTHGRVGFQIETNNSHIPAFNISHKADKWTVWGNYVGNISHSKSDENEFKEYIYASEPNNPTKYTYSYSTNSKTKLNALSFGANYKDDKNSLTLEVFNRDAPVCTNSETIYPSDNARNITKDAVVKMFSAIADWKHTLNEKSSFGVNISRETGKHDVDISYKGSSSPEYKRQRVNATRFDVHLDSRPYDFFGIKAGVKGLWKNAKYEEMKYSIYSVDRDSSQFTPYVLAQFNVGQFKFTAGERYDFNNVEDTHIDKQKTMTITEQGSAYKSFNSSLTTVSAEWKPNANHSVMASYRRHATRICDFVFESINQDNRYYYELTPRVDELNYNVYNLNYAYTGENVSAGLKAQYYRTNYVFPNAYNTYREETRTVDIDLYDITASVAYHQDMFAVTSDLNFYKYDGKVETTGSPYHYSDENYEYTSGNVWIFRLTPMLLLKNNFKVSASAMFVSHRVDKNYYLLEDVKDDRRLDKWLTLRVAKSWKNLDLYVKWENAFDKREDYNDSSRESSYKTIGFASENKFENRLTFGGSFRF